jgi:hypothetical protein
VVPLPRFAGADGASAPVLAAHLLAQTLIEYLEAGDTIEDFLEGFPSVTREQVFAFLEEAKEKP